MPVGPQIFRTEAGATMVEGGGWRLNSWQTDQLPIDTPLALSAATSTATASGATAFPPLPTIAPLTPTTIAPSLQPPQILSRANTAVEGNQLVTCRQNLKVGCLRISFAVGVPSTIAMLGQVSPETGRMTTDGWKSPKNWLCSGSVINRVCPMSVSGDVNNGLQHCGEIKSKEELFETLHSENKTTTWIFRVMSLLVTWIGLCMICSPITRIVQMATGFLDQITSCIPGVGCLVDYATDLFVGLVQSVVCCITCMCAVSSFLLVAGIVWVVMRPLYAIPMVILGICLCGGAGFAMHHFKKNKTQKQHADRHADTESE